MESKYSNDPRVILGWAKRAKGIYIPLPGTGGGNVMANKRDFIAAMENCGDSELETEYTLHPNNFIYC